MFHPIPYIFSVLNRKHHEYLMLTCTKYRTYMRKLVNVHQQHLKEGKSKANDKKKLRMNQKMFTYFRKVNLYTVARSIMILGQPILAEDRCIFILKLYMYVYVRTNRNA